MIGLFAPSKAAGRKEAWHARPVQRRPLDSTVIAALAYLDRVKNGLFRVSVRSQAIRREQQLHLAFKG